MAPPVRRGLRTLRRGGLRPFTYRVADYLGLWCPVWNTVTSRFPRGRNVFEHEWDLLVVLDACRPDSLEAVSGSYPWLDTPETVSSVGSMSAEWVLQTFTDEYRREIEQTALVSRNVWSSRILCDRVHEAGADAAYDYVRRGLPAWNVVPVETLAHYERVQATGNQDDRLHPESTSIPHVVTDRAIDVSRRLDPDRLVVWYRMPHLNYVADAVDWRPDLSSEDLMSGLEPTRELRPEEQSLDPLADGTVSRARVREHYRQNLRLVLSYVDILLRNVDAERTVVTADHGEGFGDGIWEHPYGYPWPPTKTVPWVETTATDEETYVSRYDRLDRDLDSHEREQLLEQMGYI